ICKYELVDTISLERHQQKHEPPGGFLCSVCKAPFTSPQERNEHKSQAHPVYRCRPCKESFYDEAQFQTHHKTVHVEPREGTGDDTPCCSTCGTHFRTTFQLRVHLESKCGTKKHFQCDICQRYYSSQASLSVHRGLHQSKKSHLCDICGASFYNRGQLKVHERVHTGDKPFKCDKCGKAFAHRESLVTHSTLHSGIKPYVCTHCNDQFSCKGNLIKHLRRRPLTCGKSEHEIKPVSDGPSSTESVVEETEPLPVVKRGKRVHISRTKVADENDDRTEHFEVQELSGSENEESDHLWPSEENTEIIPTVENGTEVNLGMEARSVVDQNEMENSAPCFEMEMDDAIPTMNDDENKKHLPGDDIPDTSDENEIELLEPSETSLTEECGKPSPDRGSDGEDSYLCVIVNNDNEITADDAQQHHWTICLKVEEVEKQLQTLKENYNIVSGVDYQCNLCPVQHTSEYLIARHLERMHGIQLTKAVEMLHLMKKSACQDKLYRCKYCGRMYSNSARLKVHMRHHGPDGTLVHKCTCCSRYFVTAEESQQHALATHRDRLECSICQKQYQDPDCLQGHIRYAHGGAKEKRRLSFVCLRCGKRFTSRSVLTDHERSNCGDSPIYECETCGKHYSSYGAWKLYVNVTTERKEKK
uniref:C2H2-type domain-containing protein n=1 Tax=Anopheles albimanus TaxID=7167 RepID=A0A182F1X9_ANOAL